MEFYVQILKMQNYCEGTKKKQKFFKISRRHFSCSINFFLQYTIWSEVFFGHVFGVFSCISVLMQKQNVTAYIQKKIVQSFLHRKEKKLVQNNHGAAEFMDFTSVFFFFYLVCLKTNRNDTDNGQTQSNS